MRNLLLAVLLLLAFLAPVRAADDAFTIASYNIENAFDVFDDPYTRDEGTDVKQRWELEAIANAIRELDADVVAFSELENEHVLRAMVSEFLPTQGYDYIAVLPTNSTRGINLGVISRRPINRLASYRFRDFTLPGHNRTWRFARDLMQVTIQATDERELDLFVVHFKSKGSSEGDPQSANWRLAEATEARKIIDELLAAKPDRWLAIVGDFNDTPDSATIGTLLRGGQLVDVHAEFPPENRITYLHPPYRSTIDFVLTSPALAERYVPGSAAVLSDEAVTRGSDHAPIAAGFDLDE